MTPQLFTEKSPNEIVPLTFDFSTVTDAVTAVVSLNISVVAGADLNVATMLSGPPEVQGAAIVQLVQAGVDEVTYELRCIAASGAERYELVGHLPVKAIP